MVRCHCKAGLADGVASVRVPATAQRAPASCAGLLACCSMNEMEDDSVEPGAKGFWAPTPSWGRGYLVLGGMSKAPARVSRFFPSSLPTLHQPAPSLNPSPASLAGKDLSPATCTSTGDWSPCECGRIVWSGVASGFTDPAHCVQSRPSSMSYLRMRKRAQCTLEMFCIGETEPFCRKTYHGRVDQAWCNNNKQG